MRQTTATTPQHLQLIHMGDKQAIERRLRNDIEQFRYELDKLDPRSPTAADRWSATIYQNLLERRTRLLNTLFPRGGYPARA